LRKWEKAGLVEPHRDPDTGYRVYTTADVRDAHLAHQLRRGGYLLRQIAPLIAQVRHAGGIEPLESTLDGWRARLSTRGLSMLTAAAELATYLEDRGHPPPTSPPT
jgi:DNA-binding transcriptional MerR regulator